MKIIEIKIDGGERTEGSLWVNERRTCGHQVDLGSLYTIEVRVLSSKFGVPKWEDFGRGRRKCKAVTCGERRVCNWKLTEKDPEVQPTTLTTVRGNVRC